jgi:ABC-type uncharacterized transport system involved in gliding motility auxiliary subunit
MRPDLLIIPFASIVVAAISTAVAKSFPAASWIKIGGWVCAAALLGLWVALDLANFKALAKRKGTKYGASSGLTILLAIAVITGIAVVTSRPRFDKSLDLTKSKANTLAEQSLKVIETLEKRKGEVNVIAFFKDPEPKKQFEDLIALYTSKGARLNIEYVDPNRDPTRAISEKQTTPNAVIFRSTIGTTMQEARVTTFNEEKVTNALVRVMKDKPKHIFFTTGHGENPLRSTEASGMNTAAVELESNRYELKELSLLEEGKVPDNADLVVIAGPKYDFKTEEARLLEEHLQRGGGLFVMVQAMVPVPVLNGLLEKYGIKVANDLLILRPDDPRAMILGQNNALVSEFDTNSALTKEFAANGKVMIRMSTTRSVEEVSNNAAGMKVSLVAKTAQIMLKVKNVSTQSDVGNGTISKDRVEQGGFPVIAVATGKPVAPETAKADGKSPATDAATGSEGQPGTKETRVVVAGSSLFATNQGMSEPESRDLMLNTIGFLLADEDFISIRPKDPTQSTLQFGSGASALTLLSLTWIYPFLFLGAGILFWIRRRSA